MHAAQGGGSASEITWQAAAAPGPLRSVTSTRIAPLPVLTATVIVSSGEPKRLCRRLLAKSPPARRSHPARLTTAQRTFHERMGHPRPLRSPRKRHGLPNRQPNAFPAARAQGNHAGYRADTLGWMPRQRTSSLDAPPDRAPEPCKAATPAASWPYFLVVMCPCAGVGGEVTHGRARTAASGGCAFMPRSGPLWTLTGRVQDAFSRSPSSSPRLPGRTRGLCWPEARVRL